MSSLTRTFVCVFAGAGLAGIVLLAFLIFGPLLFPLSLSDAESDRNWNLLFTLMMSSALVFGIAGFVLTWKFTKRAVKD